MGWGIDVGEGKRIEKVGCIGDGDGNDTSTFTDPRIREGEVR